MAAPTSPDPAGTAGPFRWGRFFLNMAIMLGLSLLAGFLGGWVFVLGLAAGGLLYTLVQLLYAWKEHGPAMAMGVLGAGLLLSAGILMGGALVWLRLHFKVGF